MENIKKLKRTTQLITILTKYGFEDIVVRGGLKKFIPQKFLRTNKNNEVLTLSIYERIRLAIEELGSTFVKLGQLMSSRDDLLPKELCDELCKLVDNVTPEEIDIKAILSNEFNINVDDVFDEIDDEPFAAASLSQIYKAHLRAHNKDVILKVKRTGVYESITIDLMLIKDIAAVVEKYYGLAQNIGLEHIVASFEKSILAELSFLQELNSIDKFRYNFRNCDTTYVPMTYPEFSNDDILCMEHISGIKISDKESLLKHGLNTKKIANATVELYLKQVFDSGFFHGDPHAGNIFVLEDGKVAFVDFGSVGRLYPAEREALADFVIFFLKKDAKRLIDVIKTISLSFNIENEALMEREISALIEDIDQNSIENLNLKSVLAKFSNIINKNKIILPDFLYLILRGIILLEGIGRSICPDLNIFEIITPYGKKLLFDRMSPGYVSKKVFEKALDFGDLLQDFPADLRSLMKKMNSGKMEVTHNINGLSDIKSTLNRVVVALLVFALSLVSGILILANVPPKVWGISLFGLLGIVLCGVIALVIMIDIFRSNKNAGGK